jgi:hypothetical protein
MLLHEAFTEFNIEIKLYGSREEIPVKYLPIYTFKDWLWSYTQNTQKLARSANVFAG